ncbi:MAG: TIGR03790 family protein [Desulfobulbaceae bacterium]|jgi:uncharacterized protein (TIGR03790 family)|nr:TIGR03790 family protein [Desulfobulbaceae bacterium]
MKKQLFLLGCQLSKSFRKKGFCRAATLPRILFLAALAAAVPARASQSQLQPEHVLVLVNTRMVGSLAMAKYYMKQRGIPEDHLLEMALTLDDTISREDYDDYVAPKVRKKLKKLAPQPIGALVTLYGMPLRIGEIPPERAERAEVDELNRKIAEYEKQLASAPVLQQQIDALRHRLNARETERDGAALDSELMLVRVEGYQLKGWIENPYSLTNQGHPAAVDKSQVLLVSRLDGPDLATVKRMIDDAIAIEKTGLTGIAYLDARYAKPQNRPSDPYGWYDAALYEAAKLLQAAMPVTLDEKDQLFAPNSCPDAALYCGWYSYGNYIDSFTWKPGAIGYHLASGECSSLRLREDRHPWCPETLSHGAAATIGPTDEPYLTAFPPPHLFFAALVKAGMTLGESYLASLPHLSWQMILVGDPLYRPFARAARQ